MIIIIIIIIINLEAQDVMEAADREGLQRVEALRYQPSW